LFVQCIKSRDKKKEVEDLDSTVNWLMYNKGMRGLIWLIGDKTSDVESRESSIVDNNTSSTYRDGVKQKKE
jgi:hypothetical protein